MSQDRRKTVEEYLNDEISLEELKTWIGEEDAEAVKASENQLKQAENLAEELASESQLSEEDVEEQSEKINRDATDSLQEE